MGRRTALVAAVVAAVAAIALVAWAARRGGEPLDRFEVRPGFPSESVTTYSLTSRR